MITAKTLFVYFLQMVGLSGFLGLEVDVSKVDTAEAYCLAENIFYEAKGEDIQGQFAVAHVTLNRVYDGRYPNTVCEVVKQTGINRATKKVVCAFSWVCEKDKKEIPIRNRDGTINQAIVEQFQIATLISVAVLSGSSTDNTRGATHFHNPNISNPAWKNELTKTMRLGNHDFYRLPPIRDR